MPDIAKKLFHVGVMGCSEFAARAMIPALLANENFKLAAVASRTPEKAQLYAKQFHCQSLVGYQQLLENPGIDFIYMPLPTGLHEEWCRFALAAGKHLLVEKSFAPNHATARSLINLAQKNKLLILENFLFPHHSQFAWVKQKLESAELANWHLFRSNFSFPPLKPGNFRYSASLGGGALLDAGAYTVKAARIFLGNDLQLVGATLHISPELGVDISGTATFVNSLKQVAQVAFGFDSFYQCNWEFIGGKSKMLVDRAYTPPPGFSPVINLERQNHREQLTLSADNHYLNMWHHIARVLQTTDDFSPYYAELEQQSFYLDQIFTKANRT